MTSLIFYFHVILFLLTITDSVPIGWLLVSSIAIAGYCVLTLLQKNEKLTTTGKWTLIVSILGIAYSMLVIAGIDVNSLFQ